MVNVEPSSGDIDSTALYNAPFPGRPTRAAGRVAIRLLPLSITAIAAVLAISLSAAMWHVYMEAPWTRDATVRAYVVTLAPEVAGRIIELHAVDNQFVHRGDLLMVIDPTNYRIALRLAEATVDQSKASAENARGQAERRRKLSDLAETIEDRQTFEAQSLGADAQYQQAVARRDQARIDLGRTEIRSPVNGWVTNLLSQQGDYVRIGQNVISIVNADSFWVDAYFEETQLAGMREGDPVRIKLMG
jgi:RND family efflux transporter MFP subunit